MSPVEPVDPRVRLAITQWPADAPRGAVTTFCLEHGIARKTFYAIRKRARLEGQAAALEPRTRRPLASPNRLSDEAKAQAVGVRAALEQSGLDHGPISVHEKMRSLGMEPVPAVSSLARIFRDFGVARVEPRKKPRASYRRFVYPAPNACWQLDATEYVLTGGRKCVIFQLIDDHSRLAIASHVTWGETSAGAIAVVSKGIEAYGVPQRLLSDNGAALNPSRRGVLGQLVVYLRSLGVEPITGKPYKPTTQGKNERFHQTLFRFLDKQPLAETLEQLQAQVDAFDVIYNTERPHQGLPGRITPALSWQATPVVDAPRPIPQPAAPAGENDRLRMTRIHDNGTVYARGAKFQVSRTLAGSIAYRIEEDDRLLIFDAQGTLLAEYLWPKPGTKYVGSGNPRGPRGPRKSR
jgi:putative transposase